MKYTTFKSLYYKAPDTIEHTYTSRYDSDLTRHFSINIRLSRIRWKIRPRF